MSSLHRDQQLSVVRRELISVPAGRLDETYRRLLILARDEDPVSQYQLSLILYRCLSVPKTENDLAAAVISNELMGLAVGMTYSQSDEANDQIQRESDECARIPADELRNYKTWLRKSVDAGNIDAMLSAPILLKAPIDCESGDLCNSVERDQSDSSNREIVEDVSRAEQAGSIDAMRIMAGWYAQGARVQNDDIEAYARFLALGRVFASNGQVNVFQEELEQLRGRLRNVDQSQAEDRVTELLENPRCCILMD